MVRGMTFPALQMRKYLREVKEFAKDRVEYVVTCAAQHRPIVTRSKSVDLEECEGILLGCKMK